MNCKDKGGLELGSLRAWNLSLRSKWLWSFRQEDGSPGKDRYRLCMLMMEAWAELEALLIMVGHGGILVIFIFY